jgi:Zn-dependent protease
MCWAEVFTGDANKYAVFLFVFIGWIVSLCLHEFAHARTAFWAGDHSVEGRGYLTLNPLKYVQPGLSLLFPLIFLLMGGIGLPGGAVWIRTGAIRTKWQRSLVSLAGPAANLTLGVVLSFVINLGGSSMESHPYFGSALSFLALLQFIAGFLNLVPIPGLDGFGAIEPHLPQGTLAAIAPYRGYSMIILFLLVTRSRGFSNLVFGNAEDAVRLFTPPPCTSDCLTQLGYGVPDGVAAPLTDVGRDLFQRAIPGRGRLL